MTNTDINQQITDLNKKVDVLLDYVNQQRLSSQAIQGLISDASIIGKDVYDSTVEELDKRQVEIRPEELTELAVGFLRNINSFNVMMSGFESIIDLSKDLTPIITESILDFSKLLADFEAKGYFEFFTKIAEIGDELVTQVSLEDLEEVKQNLPEMIQIVRKLSDKKTLKLVNRALDAVDSVDIENPPEMGIWSLMKSMNNPSMQKSLGLVVSISKNMYKNESN